MEQRKNDKFAISLDDTDDFQTSYVPRAPKPIVRPKKRRLGRPAKAATKSKPTAESSESREVESAPSRQEKARSDPCDVSLATRAKDFVKSYAYSRNSRENVAVEQSAGERKCSDSETASHDSPDVRQGAVVVEKLTGLSPEKSYVVKGKWILESNWLKEKDSEVTSDSRDDWSETVYSSDATIRASDMDTESDVLDDLALAKRLAQQELAEDLEADGLSCCQICQKDISHMNSQRQLQHVNKCIDQQEKVEKENSALENAKDAILPCPMCAANFKVKQTRTSHLKMCAKKHKISPRELQVALYKQEQDYLRDLIDGKLPGPAVPGKGKKKAGTKKKESRVLKEPTNQYEEDIQMTLALSRSLVEITSAPPPPGPAKKAKGKKKEPPKVPLLVSRGSEERRRMIEDSLCRVLQNGSYPNIEEKKLRETKLKEWDDSVELLHGHQEDALWSRCCLVSNDDDIDWYYVSCLMPPIVPCKVAMGSKIKRMSQVPGRKKSLSSQLMMSPVKTVEHAETSDTSADKSDILVNASPVQVDVEAHDISDHIQATGFCTEKEEEKEQETKSKTPCPVQTKPNEDLLTDLKKMIDNPFLSDISIICKDVEYVPAHKFILGARCPKLLDNIQRDKIINLIDVSKEAVLGILKYLYTGEVTSFEKGPVLDDVMKLAERLDLEVLIQHCQQKDEVKPGVEDDEYVVMDVEDLLKTLWEDELDVSDKEPEDENVHLTMNDEDVAEIYEFMSTQKSSRKEGVNAERASRGSVSTELDAVQKEGANSVENGGASTVQKVGTNIVQKGGTNTVQNWGTNTVPKGGTNKEKDLLFLEKDLESSEKELEKVEEGHTRGVSEVLQSYADDFGMQSDTEDEFPGDRGSRGDDRDVASVSLIEVQRADFGGRGGQSLGAKVRRAGDGNPCAIDLEGIPEKLGRSNLAFGVSGQSIGSAKSSPSQQPIRKSPIAVVPQAVPDRQSPCPIFDKRAVHEGGSISVHELQLEKNRRSPNVSDNQLVVDRGKSLESKLPQRSGQNRPSPCSDISVEPVLGGEKLTLHQSVAKSGEDPRSSCSPCSREVVEEKLRGRMSPVRTGENRNSPCKFSAKPALQKSPTTDQRTALENRISAKSSGGDCSMKKLQSKRASSVDSEATESQMSPEVDVMDVDSSQGNGNFRQESLRNALQTGRVGERSDAEDDRSRKIEKIWKDRSESTTLRLSPVAGRSPVSESLHTELSVRSGAAESPERRRRVIPRKKVHVSKSQFMQHQQHTVSKDDLEQLIPDSKLSGSPEDGRSVDGSSGKRVRSERSKLSNMVIDGSGCLKQLSPAKSPAKHSGGSSQHYAKGAASPQSLRMRSPLKRSVMHSPIRKLLSPSKSNAALSRSLSPKKVPCFAHPYSPLKSKRRNSQDQDSQISKTSPHRQDPGSPIGQMNKLPPKFINHSAISAIGRNSDQMRCSLSPRQDLTWHQSSTPVPHPKSDLSKEDSLFLSPVTKEQRSTFQLVTPREQVNIYSQKTKDPKDEDCPFPKTQEPPTFDVDTPANSFVDQPLTPSLFDSNSSPEKSVFSSRFDTIYHSPMSKVGDMKNYVELSDEESAHRTKNPSRPLLEVSESPTAHCQGVEAPKEFENLQSSPIFPAVPKSGLSKSPRRKKSTCIFSLLDSPKVRSYISPNHSPESAQKSAKSSPSTSKTGSSHRGNSTVQTLKRKRQLASLDFDEQTKKRRTGGSTAESRRVESEVGSSKGSDVESVSTSTLVGSSAKTLDKVEMAVKSTLSGTAKVRENVNVKHFTGTHALVKETPLHDLEKRPCRSDQAKLRHDRFEDSQIKQGRYSSDETGKIHSQKFKADKISRFEEQTNESKSKGTHFKDSKGRNDEVQKDCAQDRRVHPISSDDDSDVEIITSTTTCKKTALLAERSLEADRCREGFSKNMDKDSTNMDGHSEDMDIHSRNMDRHSEDMDHSQNIRDSRNRENMTNSYSRNSNKHSSNRDSPSLNRDSPLLNRKSPSRKSESPSLNRDRPSLNRDSSSLNRKSPSLRDSPSLNSESPSLNRDSPLLNRKSHSRNSESPSLNWDSPLLNRKSPSRNSESPSLNRNSLKNEAYIDVCDLETSARTSAHFGERYRERSKLEKRIRSLLEKSSEGSLKEREEKQSNSEQRSSVSDKIVRSQSKHNERHSTESLQGSRQSRSKVCSIEGAGSGQVKRNEKREVGRRVNTEQKVEPDAEDNPRRCDFGEQDRMSKRSGRGRGRSKADDSEIVEIDETSPEVLNRTTADKKGRHDDFSNGIYRGRDLAEKIHDSGKSKRNRLKNSYGQEIGSGDENSGTEHSGSARIVSGGVQESDPRNIREKSSNIRADRGRIGADRDQQELRDSAESDTSNVTDKNLRNWRTLKGSDRYEMCNRESEEMHRRRKDTANVEGSSDSDESIPEGSRRQIGARVSRSDEHSVGRGDETCSRQSQVGRNEGADTRRLYIESRSVAHQARPSDKDKRMNHIETKDVRNDVAEKIADVSPHRSDNVHRFGLTDSLDDKAKHFGGFDSERSDVSGVYSGGCRISGNRTNLEKDRQTNDKIAFTRDRKTESKVKSSPEVVNLVDSDSETELKVEVASPVPEQVDCEDVEMDKNESGASQEYHSITPHDISMPDAYDGDIPCHDVSDESTPSKRLTMSRVQSPDMFDDDGVVAGGPEITVLSDESDTEEDINPTSSSQTRETVTQKQPGSHDNHNDTLIAFLDDESFEEDHIMTEDPPPARTPASYQPRKLAAPSPFTPMPDYESMGTPQIKKELQKFGLRPQGKKKACKLLKNIYQETHQYETDPDLTPAVKGHNKGQPVKVVKERIKRVVTYEDDEHWPSSGPSDDRLFGDLNDDTEFDVSLRARLGKGSHASEGREHLGEGPSSRGCSATQGSDEDADGDGPTPSSSSESSQTSFDEGVDSDSSTEANLTLSQQVSVQERILKYMTTDNDLYTKVLTYEPIDLVELHSTLKEAGLVCSMNKLMDILDEQCITFKMKRKSRVTKTRGRKTKKATQVATQR